MYADGVDDVLRMRNVVDSFDVLDRVIYQHDFLLRPEVVAPFRPDSFLHE